MWNTIINLILSDHVKVIWLRRNRRASELSRVAASPTKKESTMTTDANKSEMKTEGR